MKRLLVLCLILVRASLTQAQPNLLYNGDFELHTPTEYYYSPGNFSPDSAVALPGWEAFAANDASSWVLVKEAAGTGNWVLDLNGTDYSVPYPNLGLAGMKTAVSNRVAVTAGAGYCATVNYDNYYDPAGISYFIDWFDAGGALLSSSGGTLNDLNGPGTFTPLTQQSVIDGIAPANAVRAGVRFQSVNGAPYYSAGATADNFQSSPLNLLYNGDFELHTPTEYYYSPGNFSPDSAVALPGWEASAANDASSWVLVKEAAGTGNWVLDLNGIDYSVPFPNLGLAGMRTAVSNRVAVTVGAGYYATVNYDNYYDPAGISYFIDWFDAGGALLSSSGGELNDPNGPGTFTPLTQQLVVAGVAPANAARAGVRFESVNGSPYYSGGATADNFLLAVQPVLNIARSGSDVILSWSKGPGFTLQKTSDLSGTPAWADLGTQNPQTIAIVPGNAFFQVRGP